MEYSGGPGALSGVGKTRIKFADQRTGKENINGNKIINKTYQVGRSRPINIDYRNLLGASQQDGLTLEENGITINGDLDEKREGYIDDNLTLSTYPDKFVGTSLDLQDPNNNFYLLTQNQINSKAESVIGNQRGLYPTDFRRDVLKENGNNTILSLSPDYQTKNVDVRTNRGNPGTKICRV